MGDGISNLERALLLEYGQMLTKREEQLAQTVEANQSLAAAIEADRENLGKANTIIKVVSARVEEIAGVDAGTRISIIDALDLIDSKLNGGEEENVKEEGQEQEVVSGESTDEPRKENPEVEHVEDATETP